MIDYLLIVNYKIVLNIESYILIIVDARDLYKFRIV